MSMPAQVSDTSKNERSDQMWKVLKNYIMTERAKRKQEQEAEVEEERLRREREARVQQDVMTLGETREQISQLEQKIQKLKDEKHQLFLQLKKVLNEDDNRRRQLLKESSEVAIPVLPAQGLVQQLYITPSGSPRAVPVPQIQPHYKTPAKRPRSPSPQNSGSPSYHQSYGYKTPQHPVQQPYQTSSPKAAQYGGQSGPYYTIQQDIPTAMYYPLNTLTVRDPPLPSRIPYDATRQQPYHLEAKLPEHYAPIRNTSSQSPHTGHIVHNSSINLNTISPPKSGSITSGYPVRTQQLQYGDQSSVLYTGSNRNMIQSPGGASINYIP